MSDAVRLKALEDEIAKLKPLLADQILDNVELKDLMGKSWRRQTNGGKQRSGRHGTVRPRSVEHVSSLVSTPKPSSACRRLRVVAVKDDCCHENLCLMADVSILGVQVGVSAHCALAQPDDEKHQVGPADSRCK